MYFCVEFDIIVKKSNLIKRCNQPLVKSCLIRLKQIERSFPQVAFFTESQLLIFGGCIDPVASLPEWQKMYKHLKIVKQKIMIRDCLIFQTKLHVAHLYIIIVLYIITSVITKLHIFLINSYLQLY